MSTSNVKMNIQQQALITHYLTLKTKEPTLPSSADGQDGQLFESDVEPVNMGINFEGFSLEDSTPRVESISKLWH